MDPLTAFSLVCGVVQVVDFSIKTLSKCKEIYHEGSLSQYQELENLTKHLVDVREKLELPEANKDIVNSVTSDEQGLLEVAGQCSETADQLVELLQSLKIDAPRKRRRAVLKTVKVLWEKHRIQGIQKRLDDHRNVLNTRILINLRQRLDLVSLQNRKAFGDLDHKVQKLIQALSQESKTLEELNDLIQTENEKIREHISGSFREYEKRSAEEEYRTRFLESLWFPEILSREEKIADAHSKTFQWIFDRSDQAVRPWDNFIAWLQGRKGTYWISGKAGSGKSTLMKVISQDERTRDALKVWSGTKDMLTPKFFFWSSGTSLQKSLEGLLRSLLWQILHEFPNMNSLTFNVGPVPQHTRRVPREHSLIGAWTKPRLLKLLQEVVDQLQSSYCLCFFIDGLDEFVEDADELIAFVQNLVSSAGVKVCSSSRPQKEFEDAFHSSVKLRLQDLTCKDIRRYVNEKFQAVPQLRSMTLGNEYMMDQLKERIVARSEGVFLWVSLAVKDQIRGLRNEDSPEQLQERLAQLPSEIEDIYIRMLYQIDKPYRQEASCFLRMALHEPGLSVLDHALARYEGLENMLLSADEAPKRELVLLCQSTRKKLITRCAGLLELNTKSESASEWITDSGSEPIDAGRDDENEQATQELDSDGSDSGSEHEITDDKALEIERKTTVGFVHRTAVDFLKDRGPGQDFLKANLSPDFDPEVLDIKLLLAQLRLQGRLRHTHDDLEIDFIMQQVAIVEDLIGTAQTGLCELLDRTVLILDRSHPDWSPGSHWCTRWGKLASMHPREQDESMNFLNFAASHGLSLYVHHTLDFTQRSVNSETLDFLLYCSIFRQHMYPTFLFQGVSKVIIELLSRGANPNSNFMGKTAWGEYLAFMTSVWSLLFENHFFAGISGNDIRHLALTTAALVEHGADVEVVRSFNNNRFWLDFQIKTPHQCWFDLQASPLSIIELCLRHDPEMPRIRKLCDTRGAIRYSRCNTLSFNVKSKTEEHGFLRKTFKLSEQESEDFLLLFESSTEASGAWDAGAYAKLARQLSDFFSRLNKSHSDSSRSSLTGTSVA